MQRCNAVAGSEFPPAHSARCTRAEFSQRENCYLKDEHKIKLCQICGELKADWVKTSTGYGTSGATIADLLLMRKHSPPTVQVKAAGGVRDLDTLLKIRETGATRCGASKTNEILDEARKRLNMEPIKFSGVGSSGGY